MKITALIFSIFLLAIGTTSHAQEFQDLDKSPMDAAYFPANATFKAFAKTDEEREAAKPKIRVLYSRPQKKGRDIYTEIVKDGEIWRAGANESTELLFYVPVRIGGQLIPTGRYTLYIEPDGSNWKVHINTDLDGWGAYAYRPKYNIATTSVATEKTPEELEALTMTFTHAPNGAYLIIAWGDRMIRLPIEVL